MFLDQLIGTLATLQNSVLWFPVSLEVVLNRSSAVELVQMRVSHGEDSGYRDPRSVARSAVTLDYFEVYHCLVTQGFAWNHLCQRIILFQGELVTMEAAVPNRAILTPHDHLEDLEVVAAGLDQIDACELTGWLACLDLISGLF